MKFFEGADPNVKLTTLNTLALFIFILLGIVTVNLTCNERPIPAIILDSCRKAKIFYEKNSGLLIQCYEIAPEAEKK